MNRRANTGSSHLDEINNTHDLRQYTSRRIPLMPPPSPDRDREGMVESFSDDDDGLDLSEVQSCVCCEVCTLAFSEDSSLRRPFVLACGHTFCKRCVGIMKKCAKCKQINQSDFTNIGGMRGSVNYQLEDLIKDTQEQFLLTKAQSEQFKSVQFCFDCMCPFSTKTQLFMSETHRCHNTTSLYKKDPSLVHSLLWIASKTRNHQTDFSSSQILLQVMLNLAHEIQSKCEIVAQSFKSSSDEFHKAIKHDCQRLIEEGINSTNFKKPALMQSMISLRNMQVELGPAILKAAHTIGPDPLPSIITAEVLKISEQDAKKTENLGVSSIDIPNWKCLSMASVRLEPLRQSRRHEAVLGSSLANLSELPLPREVNSSSEFQADSARVVSPAAEPIPAATLASPAALQPIQAHSGSIRHRESLEPAASLGKRTPK